MKATTYTLTVDELKKIALAFLAFRNPYSLRLFGEADQPVIHFRCAGTDYFLQGDVANAFLQLKNLMD
jgi:hypothetical protein